MTYIDTFQWVLRWVTLAFSLGTSVWLYLSWQQNKYDAFFVWRHKEAYIAFALTNGTILSHALWMLAAWVNK